MSGGYDDDAFEAWKNQRVPVTLEDIHTSVIESSTPINLKENRRVGRKRRANVIESDEDEDISLLQNSSQSSVDSSFLDLDDTPVKVVRQKTDDLTDIVDPGIKCVLEEVQQTLDYNSSDDDDEASSCKPNTRNSSMRMVNNIIKSVNSRNVQVLKKSPAKKRAVKYEHVSLGDADDYVQFIIRHQGNTTTLKFPKANHMEVVYKTFCEGEGIKLGDLELWHHVTHVEPSRLVGDVADEDFIILDTIICKRGDTASNPCTQIADDEVRICLQSGENFRDRKDITVKKNETFGFIKQKYVSEMKPEYTNMKWIFDNEYILDNQTPIGLEMEDGDRIDVM